MRKLQMEELQMMVLIKHICESENLSFYMIGGTLLGAIRHKGFILWDDDVDLGMPRKDYDKFLAVAHKYFPQNIILQNFYTDSDYRYFITRMLNKKIKVEEKRMKNVCSFQSYAAIDIFPIDGSPNLSIFRKVYYMRVLIRRYLISLCYRDSVDFDRKRSRAERGMLIILLKIPFEKFFSPNKIKENLNKLLKKHRMDASNWSGTIMGAYRLREMVPTRMFGTPTYYEFEGINFPGPESAHEYLAHIYGDYMTLPPIENQKTHYTNIIIADNLS